MDILNYVYLLPTDVVKYSQLYFQKNFNKIRKIRKSLYNYTIDKILSTIPLFDVKLKRY